jgi:hypothetical protein
VSAVKSGGKGQTPGDHAGSAEGAGEASRSETRTEVRAEDSEGTKQLPPKHSAGENEDGAGE